MMLNLHEYTGPATTNISKNNIYKDTPVMNIGKISTATDWRDWFILLFILNSPYTLSC
jgi:hypothetical protein